MNECLADCQAAQDKDVLYYDLQMAVGVYNVIIIRNGERYDVTGKRLEIK